MMTPQPEGSELPGDPRVVSKTPGERSQGLMAVLGTGLLLGGIFNGPPRTSPCPIKVPPHD